MNEHAVEGGARAAAEDAPPEREVAGFYNDISGLLTELFGGSLHEGYWESPSDRSTMAEASQRLTDLLTEKLKAGPGDTVLDVGCGSGAPAIRLARVTGARVVGITNSDVQIQAAVRNAQDAGMGEQVTFRCEDATVLDFPAGSFDGVLMIESIFHLPDRLGALREAAKVLKPGGRLALTDLLDLTPVRHGMAEAMGDLAEHGHEHGHAPLVARPIPLRRYETLLEEAGLVPVELTDVTEHTVAPTLACIRKKLDEDHDRLVETFGSQVVKQYETVLPLLESAGFGYAVVVAEVPGG
ncbi:SAM-dependent methyltransferase [Streptomyces sp. CB03234]|uniref:SAM-dependent methyltransferase n=1 Tax=Streptomyces sp. (strain CB03234) TaxID=1703937 RepID=UPI00093DEB8F|nr:methyltransferase domain-containing protein [Streptomyces sp. CB03234]